MTSRSLRAELKSSTSECHRQLDAGIAKTGAFENDEAYQHYLNNMGRLHHRYGWAEAFVCSHSDLSPQSDAVVEALARDVSIIGGSRKQFSCTTSDSRDTGSRDSESASAAWGATYVLEGASLGAKFILKAVQQHMPETPTNYLTLIAGNGSTRWPKFCAALEQSEADPEVACRAAIEVFEFANRLFQQASTKDIVS